jgi:hypothetical protein
MPFVPKFLGEISLIWAVFYLLVLVFIVQASVRPGIKLMNAWTVILAFYLLVVLVSVSWANHYSYNLYTLERIYARFLAPLIIATISLNLFTMEDKVQTYIKNLMAAAFILSLIGIVQTLIHGPTNNEEFRAGAGTLENPNALAIFLVVAIPCILHALEKRIVPRILAWPAMICTIAGIICTVSRKGITTMAIVFILYFSLKKQFRKLALSVLVGVVLAVSLSSTSLISQRFTAKSINTNLRQKVIMASAGWQMFKEHPLIGMGYNGYYENFSRYLPNLGRKKYDAHNIYITELANRGLLGFIPFVSIFLYPLIVSIRRLHRSSPGHQKDMAVISIVSILPFMVSGFFAGGLFWAWFTIFVLYTHISFVFSASAQDQCIEQETEQKSPTLNLD